MKNLIIILLIAIVLGSCKNDTKTDSIPNDIENSNVEDVMLLEEIKGSDSEPAWNIVISNKSDKQFSFELTTMLGSKKTTGHLVLQSDFSKKSGSSSDLVGQDSNGENITVTLTHQKCLDLTGKDSGNTIQVEWNEQLLSGCAVLKTRN